MAQKRFTQETARLEVENTDHIISCRRDDLFRIRRPIDEPHVSSMARQSVEDALPSRDIPYGNSIIVACSREVEPIGRI
jgi:hypothetical protein